MRKTSSRMTTRLQKCSSTGPTRMPPMMKKTCSVDKRRAIDIIYLEFRKIANSVLQNLLHKLINHVWDS